MAYRTRLASGRVAFAHLVRLWHARNGWSHRVLPGLAEALELGRVHNSQLSMLRNGKLASPGPEVFLSLGTINLWLAEQAPHGVLPPDAAERLLGDHPDLIEALTASALPIRDDRGQVLGPGALLEVFVGVGTPPAGFDLRIAEAEAPALSAALSELLCAGRSWRQCRETVMSAYPVARRQRRERFGEVMAGQADYTATEMDAELPDLRRTLATLSGGAQDLPADAFLALLRRKAIELDQAACMNGSPAAGPAFPVGGAQAGDLGPILAGPTRGS